jgi:putative transposase
MLNRTFGCVRLVWNRTLAERSCRYRTEGKPTSYRETDAALTAWKRTDELAFLSEVSCVPLQQTLRHQHTAYLNFFAGRARFPRFKSRVGRQSAHFTRSAFRLREGQLHLAKTAGPIRFTWSFDQVNLASLDPSKVVVTRESDHRWYITFTVDISDPAPLPPAGRSIGVDLGVKDFLVTSDGHRVANPQHLQRKARNLARYQRRLARAQRGSRNRLKARRRVAVAHRKVRDARRDFLHRTSSRIVRGADVIVTEDLAIANMVRNRRMARAISDAAWGEFRAML